MPLQVTEHTFLEQLAHRYDLTVHRGRALMGRMRPVRRR